MAFRSACSILSERKEKNKQLEKERGERGKTLKV
jgi:hypothetical protein